MESPTLPPPNGEPSCPGRPYRSTVFPPIEYLEWIAGRPEQAAYDLGTSDLRAARPPVEAPATDRDDPVADLEGLLAAEYGVEREQVLVTAGASHANFVAFAAALDSGRAGESETEASTQPRVLVEKPGYEPLLATPAGLGARVDRFVRPFVDGYPLQASRVAAAAHDDTNLVIVTNRHNPSGTATDRTTLRGAARAAESEGPTLLVDEVYAPFETEPDAGGAFGGPTAAGVPNAVVTSSVTKFFGLGSFRIGWLVGPADFVERARSVAWHVPTVSASNAAIVADVLEDAGAWSEHSRDVVAANHDLLASFVADRPDLDGFVPAGCPYAFLAHEQAGGDRSDGDAVADAAWDRGVLVVPGRFFDASDRFRVSLGGEPAAVREGLATLGEVLDGL